VDEVTFSGKSDRSITVARYGLNKGCRHGVTKEAQNAVAFGGCPQGFPFEEFRRRSAAIPGSTGEASGRPS
jgi:hypothetical protein